MRFILVLLLSICAYAQTSPFPAAPVTDAELTVASNRFTAVVTGPVAIADTTMLLSNIVGGPPVVNLLLSVDDEIVKVTSVVGSAIQVTRAFDGTVAAVHAAGSPIGANITAWHHNAMAAEVKAIEGNVVPAPASANALHRTLLTAPNFSTLATLYNGVHFDIGGYPDADQWTPSVQTLVGTVQADDGPSGGLGVVSGVSGYARTLSRHANAVAMFGLGTCSGQFTQCWGGNLSVQHDATNINGSNMTGLEVDVNHSEPGGQNAAIITGIGAVANIITAPSGFSVAFVAQRGGSSPLGWNTAYQSSDGGATTGLYLGSAGLPAVTSQSQNLIFNSYTGASAFIAQQFEDSGGNFWIRPSVGAAIYLDPNVGSPVVAVVPAGLTIAPAAETALPACSGPFEGTMRPVTNSNVNTWGAAITATGAFHVLAYCNGTAWTVAAK